MSRLHHLLLLMPLLLLIGLAAGCGSRTPVPSLEVGETAPAFELPSLDGSTVSSQQLLGQPLVLNFWATWCQPCLYEIPLLKTVERSFGVAVVAIALDEEGEEVVRPFVEKHGLEYTVALGDRELFTAYGGYAIPYTLVLDASHKIVAMYRGVVSERTLERDLHRLDTATAG